MKAFVADIIPKIQRYSQKLDNLVLLTNKHWVVLDEIQQSKTVYIFRQTNELLISINGKVEKGRWEHLGQNSILIDLKENSYLFRHGFFDENILALKVDSKEEYAVLINETKYQGELNSISTVLQFLKQNYITNPVLTNKLGVGHEERNFPEFMYQREGYSLKTGSFKEFIVKSTTGQKFNVYQKKFNGKYFIYMNKEILIFQNKESCLKFIEGQS